MSKHLQREMENLKTNLLGLCASVEKSVALATRAIEERDDSLARQVIDGDVSIDRSEVTIEEDCLKILALHQPVAIDLRVLVSVMKIDNDLERIGDLAVNIAERAIHLCRHSVPVERFNFSQMAERVMSMLRRSVDALVQMDVEMARAVCDTDSEVDEMNRDAYTKVESMVITEGQQLAALTHVLSVSRHLERIADHATNIAEDVMYMISGEIVRHQAEDGQTRTA